MWYVVLVWRRGGCVCEMLQGMLSRATPHPPNSPIPNVLLSACVGPFRFAHSSQIPTQDMRLGEGNGDSIHHSQGKQWRQPHFPLRAATGEARRHKAEAGWRRSCLRADREQGEGEALPLVSPRENGDERQGGGVDGGVERSRGRPTRSDVTHTGVQLGSRVSDPAAPRLDYWPGGASHHHGEGTADA